MSAETTPRPVDWKIERVHVDGGPSVYELIIVVGGRVVDRALFAYRDDAYEARDAAVAFYAHG